MTIRDTQEPEEEGEEEVDDSLEFRKEALEHTLFGSTRYHLLTVVRIRDILIVAPIALLIFFITLWSFMGKIHIWVDGRGVLLPSEGNLHMAILNEGSGELEKYLVTLGETVKKNQSLARLENKTLEDHAKSSQKYLDDLIEIHKKLQQEAKEEHKKNQESIIHHSKIHNESIEKNKEFITYLQKILNQIAPLASRNLVPSTRMESLIENIKQTQERINTSRNQIIDEEIRAREFLERWNARINDLELKIKAQRHENNKIRQQLEAIQGIVSPIDGKVISLLKTHGDYVNKGDGIALIAKQEESLESIVFVSPEEGKKILPGQKALVIPTTVKREEFGGIEGEVVSVSHVPSSKSRLMAILQNESLVKSFMPNESAPFEVRIKLTPCPNCYTKYKWTSSKGPNLALSAGMITNGRILVRSQAPVTLLIPAFKRLMED